MYKVQFVMQGFSWPKRQEAARRMQYLLECLTKMNIDWIRCHPRTPLLYRSGVVYEREPPGREDWQDIPTTLARQSGDCEDLATWRAAELQARGWPAVAFGTPRPMLVNGGQVGTLWHIRVLHPNGRIEDPSKRLGMNSEASAGLVPDQIAVCGGQSPGQIVVWEGAT